jgi:hypothetical protein
MFADLGEHRKVDPPIIRMGAVEEKETGSAARRIAEAT